MRSARSLRTKTLTSSHDQGGTNVQEFEDLSKRFLNCKYAVAVNSGTAALQASLLALNIKSGDEVLLPSFTFVATANAVVSTGARPVFVDILADSYTMDPEDLEKKNHKALKGHLFRFTCTDMHPRLMKYRESREAMA